MEAVTCPSHSDVFCYLKTGLKPGPSQGQSFYVCTKCPFFKTTTLKPVFCPNHSTNYIELQSIYKDDRKGLFRRYYRCAGKEEGKTWCGYISMKDATQTDDKVSNKGQLASQVAHSQVYEAATSKHKNETIKIAGIELPQCASQKTKDCVKVETVTHNGNPSNKADKLSKSSSEDMSVICISESDSDSEEDEVKKPGALRHSKDVKSNTSNDVNSSKSDTGMSFASLSKSAGHSAMSSCSDMDVSFASQSFRSYRDSPVKPVLKQRSVFAGTKKGSDSESSEDDDDEPEEKHVTKELQNMSISIEEQKFDTKQTTPSGKSNSKLPEKAIQRETTKTEVKTQSTVHPPESMSKTSGGKVSQKHEGKEQFPIQNDGGGAKQRVEYQETADSLLAKRRGLYADLAKLESTMRTLNLAALPDKGERLIYRFTAMKEALREIDSRIKALRSQEANSTSQSSDRALPKEKQTLLTDKPYTTNTSDRPPLKDIYLQPQHRFFSASNMIPRAPAPVKQYNKGTSQPPITNHLVRGPPPTQQQQQIGQAHHSMDHLVFSQLPVHLQRMYADNPQAQTLYGGRMTAQRLREVGTITTDALDALHKQLKTCPNENVAAPDPAGLNVTLKPHQRQALAWLAWREEQQPSGGILADDMGLGKTLTTIAHVIQQKQKRPAEESGKDCEKDKWLNRDKTVAKLETAVKKTKATLIVAPASVVHQWAKEIERRCKPGTLKFLVYHGPNRERNIHRLIDNDIVLTTYTIISKEVGVDKTENAEAPAKDPDEDPRSEIMKDKTPYELPMLLKIGWERIVLDEAHNIKNHKSLTSMSICKLRAAYRWALTGTPIQNDLLDMYSLIRFLRFSPFDEFKVWKRHVDIGRGETKRLNTIVQALLLRRTKEQTSNEGKPLVELPTKSIHTVEIKLGQEERTVYEKLFRKTQSTVREYVNRHNDPTNRNNNGRTGSSPVNAHVGSSSSSTSQARSESSSRTPAQKTGSQILVMLLRLRQCCSHLSLMKDHLETESLESDGIELSLDEQLRGMQLEELAGDNDQASTDLAQSKLFNKAGNSTKLKCVIDKMVSITSNTAGDKCVVVSQWTRMLEIVAHHLDKVSISHAVIQGNIPAKKRMELVEEFNLNPRGPKVMLVSLRAGGVGLNLIGGNHLFLLDSHWNPALEEQACDRIYRMGQTKDVNIYRFLCKDTIEEKIMQLQKNKLSLAKSVLTGSDSKTEKLSLNDLRLMFGV